MFGLLTWLILLVAALFVGALVVRSARKNALYDQLDLPLSGYRIIGHDLGESRTAIKISAFGINGKPDVIAEHKRKRRIRVYDVKARRYSGRVSNYELFQMTLYVGILRTTRPGYEVEGYLKFRDQVVPVSYSHRLFISLKDLKPEAVQAMRNWKPINKTPLLARRR